MARRTWQNPRARLGLLLLIVLIGVTTAAPYLAPADPDLQTLANSNRPPSWAGEDGLGLFGTDNLGRDILSRVMFALRTSLLFGVATATGAAVLGAALGLIGGYLDRSLGPFLMRVADIQFSVPFFAVGVALVGVMGPGLVNLAIALMIWSWPTFARTIYARVVQIKKSDHVTAIRSLGGGTPRILLRHILPNVVGPVLVLWATLAGGFILAESALSLLGLGVQPPEFSLGSMLASARAALATAWWAALFPGVSIGLCVLSFQLIGDAVRDALNPSRVAHSDPVLS